VQTDIVESASPDLWPMTLRPPDDKIGPSLRRATRGKKPGRKRLTASEAFGTDFREVVPSVKKECG
jgi:hypothetical protein